MRFNCVPIFRQPVGTLFDFYCGLLSMSMVKLLYTIRLDVKGDSYHGRDYIVS
ncbi:hypothetical protein UCCLB556_1956 [Levilactobacillus brevis]|nr:hypothetical protein UCCLB556_1956 [Levilactobacillus brevis]